MNLVCSSNYISYQCYQLTLYKDSWAIYQTLDHFGVFSVNLDFHNRHRKQSLLERSEPPLPTHHALTTKLHWQTVNLCIDWIWMAATNRLLIHTMKPLNHFNHREYFCDTSKRHFRVDLPVSSYYLHILYAVRTEIKSHLLRPRANDYND